MALERFAEGVPILLPNPKYHIIILCFAVILRRMSDLEKPLVLRLLWGGADLRHTFSLQENETGDIIVSDKSLN